QLEHAAAHPELRVTSTITALGALGNVGLLDAEQVNALQSAWELASRARNAVFLVRGRPGDQLPRQGLELNGVARACGYGADIDAGEFLDDYRRIARRARSVVEQVFYGRSEEA
ncbi:MAG: glnE, partial [Modestobacter sp.]|nr:glnE [Modestobacter sp.]